MSYYDEPETIIHARIASERSGITDLKYTYKKVVITIMSSNPEDISDDLIQQQLNIIEQIKERKQKINLLEYQLEALNPPVVVPVVEPVVDLSNNVVDPVVDLSNNVVDPVIDASNNVVDLSNNVVEPVVDASNIVVDPVVEPVIDASNNVVQPLVDLSNKVL